MWLFFQGLCQHQFRSSRPVNDTFKLAVVGFSSHSSRFFFSPRPGRVQENHMPGSLLSSPTQPNQTHNFAFVSDAAPVMKEEAVWKGQQGWILLKRKGFGEEGEQYSIQKITSTRTHWVFSIKMSLLLIHSCQHLALPTFLDTSCPLFVLVLVTMFWDLVLP